MRKHKGAWSACEWLPTHVKKCPSTWPTWYSVLAHNYSSHCKTKLTKEGYNYLWILTAEEKICSWSSQQPGAAGQGADESADPAEHQEDQAEGQHDDHHLMQT